MPAGRPQTIAPEVLGGIQKWLATASTYAQPNDFFFKSTLQSAEKLSNADSFAGALAKAFTYHLIGEIDESLHWVGNLRKYQREPMAVSATEAIVLSNLGYFGRATDVFRKTPAEPGMLEAILLVCGSFEMLLARAEGTALADTEKGREIILVAERCVMTLSQFGIQEAQLQSVLELAGEVLRSHRMFFADELPLIRTNEDGLLYQLRVRVDPSVAAQYTDEVIDLMIERDLDVDGLSFSFLPA